MVIEWYNGGARGHLVMTLKSPLNDHLQLLMAPEFGSLEYHLHFLEQVPITQTAV